MKRRHAQNSESLSGMQVSDQFGGTMSGTRTAPATSGSSVMIDSNLSGATSAGLGTTEFGSSGAS